MIKDIIDANKNIDTTSVQLKQLKEIFPGAFHGGTVDLEYIKNQLKEVKTTKEGYELNFLGKSYAKLLASLDTETVIVPDIEHNQKEENKNSQNLYITADNLDALKHLLKSYWHKVKMIYIDPPYNTGSDGFVYNDSFNFTKDTLIEKLGLSNEEAERIIDMTNSKSSSHSAWLTFMYPRLYLARQLLTDDGVVFISIDENELSNLKLICDEIFGEHNFITKFIWEKTQHFGRQKLNSYSNADYILCYAKYLIDDKLKELLVEFVNSDLQDAPLFNASNSTNTLTFPAGSVKFNLKDGTYNKTSGEDYELLNPVDVRESRNANDFSLRFKSRWSNKTVQDEVEKGTTFWVKTDTFAIRAIYGEGKTATVAPKQIIFTNINNEYCAKNRNGLKVGTSEKATNDLDKLMNCKCFSYPKPVTLITYLMSMLYDETKQDFDNDYIVLDFFSGSSTTAHATLELNAEDGGNRKFIMVQLPEQIDENSEAYELGYRSIDQIGMSRIQEAAKRIKNELGLFESNFDFGFKHFATKQITQNQLSKLDAFNPSILLSDRDILDEFGLDTVLTTWINLDGYGLSKGWSELILNDYSAYQIEETIYLINPNISDKSIKALIEKFDDDTFICKRIILFGYSFTMSEIQSIKDNLKQVNGIRHISLDIMVRY